MEDDLRMMCEHWDGTDKQFAIILELAVEVYGARDLAKELEVVTSTINRWSSGFSRPLPGVIYAVVKYLKYRE